MKKSNTAKKAVVAKKSRRALGPRADLVMEALRKLGEANMAEIVAFADKKTKTDHDHFYSTCKALIRRRKVARGYIDDVSVYYLTSKSA